MNQVRFFNNCGLVYSFDLFSVELLQSHTLVVLRKLRDSQLMIIAVVSSHMVRFQIGPLGWSVSTFVIFTLSSASLHIISLTVFEDSLTGAQCFILDIVGHGRPRLDRLCINVTPDN